MQARLSLTRDTISPDLRRALKATENPRPALQAVGLYIESRAKRAFDEPALRPAAWRQLSSATLRAKARKNLSSRILRANGTLWRSLRITSLSSTSVTIGTDRPYGKFHQLGTKHIPARPFFPFDSSGRLVPDARTRVESLLRKRLGLDK